MIRGEAQFVDTHVFHNDSVLSTRELFSSRRIGNKRAIGKRKRKRGKGDKTSFVRYGGRARSVRSLSEVRGPKRGEKRMKLVEKDSSIGQVAEKAKFILRPLIACDTLYTSIIFGIHRRYDHIKK